MQRALTITAAGGVLLYTSYLLIHGERPRVIQRAGTTMPSPIEDRTQQPAVSGSVSSLTNSIAQQGDNPTIIDRPVALGGDYASTGSDQEAVTHKSMEQSNADELDDYFEPPKQETSTEGVTWNDPYCARLDEQDQAGFMEMLGCHKEFP